MIVVALMAGLFAISNKEFFDTVAEQIHTHDWHQINCRQVDPELPALTIKTHTGKEIVCNKLVKD
tara:strand:- start:2360 stop:2554 length:195 start_codon:yes stop_codon:yes gene_type:complete